jgi:hypothetical protein
VMHHPCESSSWGFRLGSSWTSDVGFDPRFAEAGYNPWVTYHPGFDVVPLAGQSFAAFHLESSSNLGPSLAELTTRQPWKTLASCDRKVVSLQQSVYLAASLESCSWLSLTSTGGLCSSLVGSLCYAEQRGRDKTSAARGDGTSYHPQNLYTCHSLYIVYTTLCCSAQHKNTQPYTLSYHVRIIKEFRFFSANWCS